MVFRLDWLDCLSDSNIGHASGTISGAHLFVKEKIGKLGLSQKYAEVAFTTDSFPVVEQSFFVWPKSHNQPEEK